MGRHIDPKRIETVLQAVTRLGKGHHDISEIRTSLRAMAGYCKDEVIPFTSIHRVLHSMAYRGHLERILPPEQQHNAKKRYRFGIPEKP